MTWPDIAKILGSNESTLRHAVKRTYGDIPKSHFGVPPTVKADTVALWYLEQGERNKSYTAKHYGITMYQLSKLLIEAGYPKEAYQSMVKAHTISKEPEQQPPVVESNNFISSSEEYWCVTFIHRIWFHIITSHNLSRTTGAALLRSASVIGFEDGHDVIKIILTFRYHLHAETCRRWENLIITETILRDYFKKTVIVRIAMPNDKTTDEPDTVEIVKLVEDFKKHYMDKEMYYKQLADKYAKQIIELQNILARKD